ncbi:MAG TPA: ATP-binding protein [Thermoanaerobaculia bacterium]|jgi:PAS domain S-box-containing protein|nr:ATP-binding protein [Thermoanaerobaculia bacterium]
MHTETTPPPSCPSRDVEGAPVDALQGRPEMAEALVRSSLDGIISIDRSGRVRVWNPAMEQLSGLVGATCVGAPLESVLERLGAPDLLPYFRRALAGEKVAAPRRHLARPDGGELTLEGHYAPVLDAGGTIGGALCVVRDVSAQEQLEEQLLQAQKIEAVGQLAGGVAHDFNNLLTVILGYCELAELRVEESSGVRGDLGEIRRAAARAAALTRQLLAFSRKQVLQPEVVSPNDEVRELEQMLRRLIAENVELSTSLAPDAGRVLVDRNQLHQVLVNLLVNARDAMPGGGRLLIETRNRELDDAYAQVHPGARPGSYVMIAVSDTGTGMDESVRSRIFEPFFTTKERGKGTGLGLSMVYGVVKQSGGYIWVYSEPGHGTTFKLFLPRVDTAAEARQAPAPSRDALEGGEAVLVAEDEEVVRGLVVRLLELRGYRVVEADRGETALAAAAATSDLELLITDVVMPDMSGRELADRLRRLRPGLKVLFVSGYTDESIANHGVLDPGVELLEKPFTADVLARRVRAILDGADEPR